MNWRFRFAASRFFANRDLQPPNEALHCVTDFYYLILYIRHTCARHVRNVSERNGWLVNLRCQSFLAYLLCWTAWHVDAGVHHRWLTRVCPVGRRAFGHRLTEKTLNIGAGVNVLINNTSSSEDRHLQMFRTRPATKLQHPLSPSLHVLRRAHRGGWDGRWSYRSSGYSRHTCKTALALILSKMGSKKMAK